MENMQINHCGSNVILTNSEPGQLSMFHDDVLLSREKRAPRDFDERRIRDE